MNRVYSFVCDYYITQMYKNQEKLQKNQKIFQKGIAFLFWL